MVGIDQVRSGGMLVQAVTVIYERLCAVDCGRNKGWVATEFRHKWPESRMKNFQSKQDSIMMAAG
jgi:hypothetical protein